MYFLGIDLGSSSVKAALLEGSTNRPVATAFYPKSEMSMIALQTGWAEQEPQEWWDATIQAVNAVMQESGVRREDVKAIGISYQMHGLVCVDKDLNPIRPSIIWCDSRAVPYGASAFDQLGHQYCLNHLLNSPGNFTAAKLAWVKENEPQTFERIHKVMLPGDYLAARMSGHAQTTYSGLSEGIFFDFVHEDISKDIMQHFGFSNDIIPEIVGTFSEQASLSGSAARELGLEAGTKITYRAGDQPNNALSLNVMRPGEIAATAGTSGVVYGITDKLKPDPLSRVNGFAHVNHSAKNRRIGILLCINGTGILYSWAQKNLKVASYEEMNNLASEVAIGSDGLIVLPFGNGAERILQNVNIGASIHHLHFNNHSKSHVIRAMKEGIAHSFKYGMDIMSAMGVHPTVIRAGNANMFLSDTFKEAVSALGEVDIELYDTDGAQGAARAAGIGLGYYDTDNAFEGLRLVKRIETDNSTSEKYLSNYTRWKDCLEGLIN